MRKEKKGLEGKARGNKLKEETLKRGLESGQKRRESDLS